MNIVIGNLCSLCAMLADSFSASRKTVKGMLLVQNIGLFFYTLCSIFLKGYSAAVQNIVGILRNFLAIRGVENRKVEWIMLIFGIVFGLVFNNLGFWGLMPVIANFQYTFAIFYFNDKEKVVKTAFLLNSVFYIIFNVVIYNFVGIVSNSIIVITTFIFLVKKDKTVSEKE